jgi:hypothetical protein
MDYEFLIKDLALKNTQKAVGTDKGLAKIGDGIVNLTYSIAKSIYLTKTSLNNTILRTGMKVSKKILATALKKANLKSFAKTRADAHDLADTTEALIAFVWLSNKISLNDIIEKLSHELKGDLNIRNNEIESATEAFTNLLNHIKEFLPNK